MSRSSKRRDGPHRSGIVGDRVAGRAARRPSRRPCAGRPRRRGDRASATMSASASSRTSATGARGVPRMSAESVPRTLPMPLENSRVTSSAPTNACHWRSASARRNVPRARSSRRDASSDSNAAWALRRRASASIASCSASSATRWSSGPSPARLPASARAARARRASRSRPRASIRARSGATASAASPSIRSSRAPSGIASTGERAGVRVRIGGVEAARVDAELGQQAVDVVEHGDAVGGRLPASG